ncbi:cuticle protein 5.1-like [Homalodisca vitripennis]|uniref:cuticle protein 5.1-like n=1 Tax=Homalodisca vitripennis TaxID=197043 RepID=UPI001EEA8522|nr:cuticle protein 5.1-like [Homalodisca vitripennis]KAG8306888.1 hypothetical protein J6590_035965 [Homalodisca vitripennis]
MVAKVMFVALLALAAVMAAPEDEAARTKKQTYLAYGAAPYAAPYAAPAAVAYTAGAYPYAAAAYPYAAGAYPYAAAAYPYGYRVY